MRITAAFLLELLLVLNPAPALCLPATSADDRVHDLAVQAYVYAYPLVLVGQTRQLRRAPLNQFAHLQSFPSAGFTAVVRPNIDTLYSAAWLDLSHEPVILSVPDTAGRYYVMQLLDAWTETFALPGSRTTGSKPGHFLIAGPGWKGATPKDVKVIQSPTNTVWIIGRTQTNGPSDYENVRAIQRGYKLAPLSMWEKGTVGAPERLTPPADRRTPPEQVAAMDAATFFKVFASLLKETSPHPVDAPLLEQLKSIGIEAGKDFDIARLTSRNAEALERAVKDARAMIAERARSHGDVRNGWRFPGKNTGRYGRAYLDRAAVALFGLGALPAEEAIYPNSFRDDDGNALNGANRYVLRFERGKLPPAGAFWSVTMYDPTGYFVSNPINRYGLGDRDKLEFDKDGSLEIYIQHESPGKEKEANWLPAPAGDFSLTLRLYVPKAAALDGSWKPPAVRRVRARDQGD
ncbi:MAG TPA: DUF1254 domain-containing protein [Blastocatellia bacterium]|nr:DUF1254 domain-containing protein [Blastocatellia bacterium]